ncbi:hypothetical protein [Acinetobacter guillouiae]|uniref:hypothetical protein n=1 Tax=Acinetobacter guillouiae TaxID=106649 RepID=UPI003AF4B17D
MKSKQKIIYQNSSDEAIKLIIEPWGQELYIDSKVKVEIQIEGGSEHGCLMIESIQKTLILYGWEGSIIDVYQDGEKIF